MDHPICFNSLCLPAEDKESAHSLLLDACFGLLEMRIDESDRFLLYYDDFANNTIYDSVLSKDNYTYNDFLNDIETEGMVDLLYFLLETEDKSPTLDHILMENEHFVEDISKYQFYIPGIASNECQDTLAFSWYLNATLLSLKTTHIWEPLKVQIAFMQQDEFIQNFFHLNNISTFEHGVELREELHKNRFQESEEPLEELYPDCVFTDEFKDWFDGLNENNHHNTRSKLELAHQRGFQGAEPLFKTLQDADGIREIRFSGYPGGAVRILFKILPNGNPSVLLGFIKKSDNEGYKENISRAQELFGELV